MSSGLFEHAADVREIRGPSAFGGGWKRFFHLTWLIAVTDYRLTYFGSVLGYLWTLMRPLMLFTVLYVVFSQIIRFGDDIPNYRDLLLMNIVLFMFFQEATGNAVRAVVNREQLVRKMHFPRMVIPLSVVVTSMLNLSANLVAVIGFLLIDGVEPRATWLLLPVAVLGLVIFTTGIAMILSSLYVSYRDVEPIWAVFAQLLFYATPVLYAIESVPEAFQQPFMASPIAQILEYVRHWVIDPGAPTGIQAIGGWPWPLIPIAIFVAVCAFGLWIFNREAPRIAERL